MQEYAGEIPCLNPDYSFPSDAADSGDFSDLNLRSQIDVKCANLAGWFTDRIVDWTSDHLDKFQVNIHPDEIGQLIGPGTLSIGEIHATIPLLETDADTSGWRDIARNSTDFTKTFADGGTAAFYAMRRWLSLRRTLTDFFEYDPRKIAIENDVPVVAGSNDAITESAKKAAAQTGRPKNYCVALQAVIGYEDGQPVTLYDGVSHAFTRAVSSLIYPQITNQEIELAREKSDRVRRVVLPGNSVEEQMASAVAELA